MCSHDGPGGREVTAGGGDTARGSPEETTGVCHGSHFTVVSDFPSEKQPDTVSEFCSDFTSLYVIYRGEQNFFLGCVNSILAQ